jgi:hypothetical protein
MPYTRPDNPAPIDPVPCAVCGKIFTPRAGAYWRVRSQEPQRLATYPWCCSNRCGGTRGGSRSAQARQSKNRHTPMSCPISQERKRP